MCTYLDINKKQEMKRITFTKINFTKLVIDPVTDLYMSKLQLGLKYTGKFHLNRLIFVPVKIIPTLNKTFCVIIILCIIAVIKERTNLINHAVYPSLNDFVTFSKPKGKLLSGQSNLVQLSPPILTKMISCNCHAHWRIRGGGAIANEKSWIRH